MKYAISDELAHVKSVGVIRNTGYICRESSTEVTSGCSSRGVGVERAERKQLQLSYISHTCCKQLNQHSPTTRTAYQEQTLEIFKFIHSVEVSL